MADGDASLRPELAGLAVVAGKVYYSVTGWTPLIDAKVVVIPRWQGLGWRLEAEIPRDALPEVSEPVMQTDRRGTADLVTVHKELPDLVMPLSFNTALHLRDATDTLRRLPWVPDEQPLANPTLLNPAHWGLAGGN